MKNLMVIGGNDSQQRQYLRANKIKPSEVLLYHNIFSLEKLRGRAGVTVRLIGTWHRRGESHEIYKQLRAHQQRGVDVLTIEHVNE